MRPMFRNFSAPQYLWLMALAMLPALSAAGTQAPLYQNINTTQLLKLMAEEVPVYDVRRAEEWRQTGVIDGSRRLTFVDRQGHMKKNFLPRFSAEVRKDQPVVVLCRAGNRSAYLARYLTEKLGYTRVYNLRDGIVSWIYEHKPVVSP